MAGVPAVALLEGDHEGQVQRHHEHHHDGPAVALEGPQQLRLPAAVLAPVLRARLAAAVDLLDLRGRGRLGGVDVGGGGVLRRRHEHGKGRVAGQEVPLEVVAVPVAGARAPPLGRSGGGGFPPRPRARRRRLFVVDRFCPLAGGAEHLAFEVLEGQPARPQADRSPVVRFARPQEPPVVPVPALDEGPAEEGKRVEGRRPLHHPGVGDVVLHRQLAAPLAVHHRDVQASGAEEVDPEHHHAENLELEEGRVAPLADDGPIGHQARHACFILHARPHLDAHAHAVHERQRDDDEQRLHGFFARVLDAAPPVVVGRRLDAAIPPLGQGKIKLGLVQLRLPMVRRHDDGDEREAHEDREQRGDQPP